MQQPLASFVAKSNQFLYILAPPLPLPLPADGGKTAPGDNNRKRENQDVNNKHDG